MSKLRKLNRKEWKDEKGNTLPNDRITDEEKYREYVVEEVFKRVRKLNKLTAEMKGEIVALTEEYLQSIAKKAELENWKGTATLRSFDKRLKIVRSRDDRIDFNENLQLAKQHIDKAIESWSSSSDPRINVLIKDVFRVDKQGTVSKSRLLGLFRYDFNDEHWITAMDYLKKAVDVVSSKEYYNFFEVTPTGDEVPVIVNFSNL